MPPEHPCLVNSPHGPHNWWYTSYGGGHQMNADFDPVTDPIAAACEKNLKQWHCPGKGKF